MLGKLPVQDAAFAAEQKKAGGHQCDKQRERHRHPPVHSHEDDHRAYKFSHGWGDVPAERGRDGAKSAGQPRNTATQGASQVFAEESLRVTRQVIEYIYADIDSSRYHGAAAEPPAQPPQDVFGGNKSNEQGECRPHSSVGLRAAGHAVHQQLHDVLNGERARRSTDHQREQPAMHPRPPPGITEQKWNRAGRKRNVLLRRMPSPPPCALTAVSSRAGP